MKATTRMGNTIRDNISLITGICMPLIVLLIGGTAGLVLRMQYQLGAVSEIPAKMSSRKQDVDGRFDRLWSINKDQYDRISTARQGVNGLTKDVESLEKRVERLEQR